MAQQLVYFADPMCSWCWGFKPSLLALLDRHGDTLPLRLIMGGLRPGNTRVMDERQKREIRNHWQHVHEASGQPFDFDFFDREGFVYDTEPACRAVVAAGIAAPDRVLDMLMGIQHGFYAGNRDATDPAVLAAIAGEVGIEPAAFQVAFDDPQTRQATWQGFTLAQSAGITGFPTLLAGNDAQGYQVLTAGFLPPAPLLARVGKWLAGHQPAAS